MTFSSRQIFVKSHFFNAKSCIYQQKKAVRSKSAGRPFFISQILRSEKKKFCVNFAY